MLSSVFQFFMNVLKTANTVKIPHFNYNFLLFFCNLNTRFAEMVTKCHKFGFFGKIKIQFFKKNFSKKFEKKIFSPFFLK